MKRWLLVLILGVGFILRIAALGQFPVGFTPDEASFGYDAYSLLKTGRDQWGQSWPVSFRSFGDFKLPVYTYLTIPSVAALGLNEFAVRLPNALVGVLAIISTYLMAMIIFRDRRIALLSSLLLAISPWHTALSRGAFEANLTVLFMSLGVWAFFVGFQKKSYMIWSAMFFGINIFTYHSARLVTPLLVAILILWNKNELGIKKFSDFGKELMRNWVPVLIFAVFLAVALSTIVTGSGARAADVTIFNPTDKWMGVYDARYGVVFGGMPYTLSVIFHNKFLDILQKFMLAYSTYISPQFLFTQGAGEWTYGMVAGWGVMYLAEIPFVLTSLWFLAKNGLNKSRGLSFILVWILISIVPAALTKGPGYAGNRVAVMMPAIQIFSAFGGIYLFDILEKRINKKILILLYSTMLGLSLIFFLEAYRFIAPRSGADGMLFGRKDAISYVLQNAGKYKEIIISRTLSEPQIYVGFYTKYDPVIYQRDSKDWLRYKDMGIPFVDQLGEYRLGKFVFKNINYIDDSKIPDVLLVGKPIEFPDRIVPTKEIFYPNQNPDLFVVDPASVSFLKQ